MDNREAAAAEFARLMEIVATLRGPQGCPWDKEQTLSSLKPYVIEEAYEVCEAIDSGSMAKLCEELGDLLLQPVLQAQLAEESFHFDLTAVLSGINAKLVRRHPHVFGDVVAETSAAVLQNWEQIKQAEHTDEARGVLDGIPKSLPSLQRAQRIQDKFARVGFDWPNVDGAIDKVREELEELLTAENSDTIQEELGDLLFAVVNVARLLQIDAEQALTATSAKVANRFRRIEESAHAQGRDVRDMSLAEMDEIWNETKRIGG